MDAYPRSTTWPYVITVLSLFVLALTLSPYLRPPTRLSPASTRVVSGASLPRLPVRLASARKHEPPTSSNTWSNTPTTTVSVAVVEQREVPAVVVHQDRTPREAVSEDSAEPFASATTPAVALPETTSAEVPATDRQVLEAELSVAAPAERQAPADDARGVVAQGEPAAPVGVWSQPVALEKMVSELQPQTAQVARWVSDVRDELVAVCRVTDSADPQLSTHWDRLEKLQVDAERLEIFLTNRERIVLRRIEYALARRLDLWRAAHRLSIDQVRHPLDIHVADGLPVLQRMDDWLQKSDREGTWRGYLRIERLRQVATETWVTDPNVRRGEARDVLQRLRAAELNPQQRAFLKSPELQPLEKLLETWADELVDVPLLVHALETYEDQPSASVAEQIMQQQHRLRYSRHASAIELAQVLEKHYRNANLRVVVDGKLLNDLLPVLEPVQLAVRDKVLGAEVRGANETSTRLQLRLIDDPHALKMRIEAHGVSQSRTVSTKGPVRLFSRDDSTFEAGKELTVTPQGIFVAKATSLSDGDSRLLDIQTDFDDIPLLGWIVRRIARDSHDEHRETARSYVGGRINSRATQQLDEAIESRLTTAESRMQQKLLEPLRELQLDPQAMELSTADDQFTIRCRLAAPLQLAAYTPRPRALADSVLSFQIHDSAPNNLLQRLQLENQRIELEQLIGKLSETLHLQRTDLHEEIPEGVVLRLGQERPIQFEFREDRVHVTIRITELRTPKKVWRNFVVRGRYRPAIGPTYVDLEREGGVELISEQLGFRDQVALRGIFTKVMTRNHRLSILRGRFEQDARLKMLGVTQFEARDGWIGVSIGPIPREKVASQPAPVTR